MTRLLRALHAGRIGVWEWDFATDHITWSDTHEATWGFAPGAFPGTLAAFLAAIHPDDCELVHLAIEHCRCGESGIRQEFRVVRADGGIRWMLVIGSAVSDDLGRPVGMTGVSVDVTEYRLADGARRELQRQLADALSRFMPQLGLKRGRSQHKPLAFLLLKLLACGVPGQCS